MRSQAALECHESSTLVLVQLSALIWRSSSTRVALRQHSSAALVLRVAGAVARTAGRVRKKKEAAPAVSLVGGRSRVGGGVGWGR